MDNLNTIKFKKSESLGWFYKIDTATDQKISFTNGRGSGTGLYKEMQAWVRSGNTIEPQYTTKEQDQKDIDDLKNALENQKLTCIHLLDDSEKAVSDDPPYPNDVEAWKKVRKQWRVILKSDKIKSIPKKPF